MIKKPQLVYFNNDPAQVHEYLPRGYAETGSEDLMKLKIMGRVPYNLFGSICVNDKVIFDGLTFYVERKNVVNSSSGTFMDLEISIKIGKDEFRTREFSNSRSEKEWKNRFAKQKLKKEEEEKVKLEKQIKHQQKIENRRIKVASSKFNNPIGSLEV